MGFGGPTHELAQRELSPKESPRCASQRPTQDVWHGEEAWDCRSHTERHSRKSAQQRPIRCESAFPGASLEDVRLHPHGAPRWTRLRQSQASPVPLGQLWAEHNAGRGMSPVLSLSSWREVRT